MDNLSKNFKALEEIDFPQGLHGKIIKKLIYKKLKTPFFTLFCLFLLNFVILGWRLWLHMEELNTSIVILSPIVGSFELSYEYFTDLSSAISQSIPLFTISATLINAVALVYIYRPYSSIRYLSSNAQIMKL